MTSRYTSFGDMVSSVVGWVPLTAKFPRPFCASIVRHGGAQWPATAGHGRGRSSCAGAESLGNLLMGGNSSLWQWLTLLVPKRLAYVYMLVYVGLVIASIVCFFYQL